MALPLITLANVVAVLNRDIQAQITGTTIEVFDDFPTDSDVVRYGVYVSDIHTLDRTPYQLAVKLGGSIYIASDHLKIVYVSFQDDENNEQVNGIIGNLTVTSSLTNSNIQFMDGYHDRSYTQDLYYGPRSAKHTWVFDLKRIELQ